MRHQFRVIGGCPCPKNIAPYIAIVLKEARSPATSIYRGDDARHILNNHGKHSQRQLYEISLNGSVAERERVGLPPEGGGVNRPGRSTHELFSDGVAYPHISSGRPLFWWQEGFDVNASPDRPLAVNRCKSAARSHGWDLFEPYPRGIEFHHLNFKEVPKPHTLRMKLRIIRVRAFLPRH
jgi:hypothetical protein